MELFAIILLGIIVISATIVIWTEIGITNDRLRWLEERLTKLEKDAVKITFTGKPNPKQFDGVKSEEPFIKTRTKRKPKTVKDWEDQFDLGGHE
jgi:hypothetical protein